MSGDTQASHLWRDPGRSGAAGEGFSEEGGETQASGVRRSPRSCLLELELEGELSPAG